MAQIICKLPNNNYLLWTTVADAPICHGMPREQFDEFMEDMRGKRYMQLDHEVLVARADKYGTSSATPRTFHSLVELNRAGPGGSTLSFDELYDEYANEPEDLTAKNSQ